ncbi:MAG: ELWxxDGT repeat protein [Thermoanaerobaculia bacterium]
MRGEWIAKALFLLTLTTQPSGAAEAPRLLKDIATQPGPNAAPGLPESFVQVNDRLLFATPSGSFADGGALWSTDGTTAGTRLVSSTLCPFLCRAIVPLATWPGIALLEAQEDDTQGFAAGKRLWRTDGTPAGTTPLTARLEPGGFEAFVPGPMPGTGLFYFADCLRFVGCQLWRTDGTLPGTYALTARTLLLGSSTSFAGRLYFQASTIAEGEGLWVSDGTAGGTRLLAALSSGASPFDVMAATPSRFFFTAGDDQELWVSDGTPAGTRLVRQSAFFNNEDCAVPVPFLEVQGETVYFLSADSVYGFQVWRSDGTESGTQRMTTIPDCNVAQAVPLLSAGGRRIFTFPYYGGSLWTAGGDFSHPAPLTGCKGGCPTFITAYPFANASPPGRLLFVGKDDQHGQELWITDGTGPGTRRLTDTCSGVCDGIDYFSPSAIRGLGKTYFRALDASEKYGLWATDGTPEGTRRVGRFPAGLGSLGNHVFFGSTRSGNTSELWMTDDTQEGSRRVATLQIAATGSYPSFAPVGDGALILALSPNGDFQTLWHSDGTPEGTVPVTRTAIPGIFGVAQVGNLEIFTAERLPELQDTVWRTDGTAGGTFPVVSFKPGAQVYNGTSWNGKYLFVVRGPHAPFSPDEDTGDCAIWASDGTRRGTRRIFPMPAGVRCPLDLFPAGSRFLFSAFAESSSTFQVFSSDGTAAGTRQLTNVADPGIVPLNFIAIDGAVFFELYQRDAGRTEIWRTDGTPAGTQGFPLGLSNPGPPVAFQGSIYLSSLDISARLWRVPLDGGAPVPLTDAADPGNLTPAGGRLFFTASDEAHGAELWVTDGTPAGTRMVRDIQPGVPSSRPGGLTAAGDRVYFAADDGVSGRELWVSDGTEEGTRLVWDLKPGGFSSSPADLAVIGGCLYFGADDGKTGEEPWALKLEP